MFAGTHLISSILVAATLGLPAATAGPSAPPLFEETMPSPLTISGLVAGLYQWQVGSGDDDANGGALTIRPSIDFALSPTDHLHLSPAFTEGNAINDDTAFELAPWSADLEDDLRDINGSGRDYLQAFWYRRTLDLGPAHELALTAGIIDSTEYLDQNALANDEYTQFLNAALVNSPIGFFPSYDLGAALEWSSDAWSASAVVMGVGENDDGESFVFVGAQLAYRLDTPLGEGNYRLVVSHASEDFRSPDGQTTESRWAVNLSVDQRVGERLGVWARLGVQDDAVAVAHDTLVSGGLNVSGALWGREQDSIGLGYAHVDGGNIGLRSTEVFESYARFGITDATALTLDAQYIRDAVERDDDVNGWVLGLRLVVDF